MLEVDAGPPLRSMNGKLLARGRERSVEVLVECMAASGDGCGGLVGEANSWCVYMKMGVVAILRGTVPPANLVAVREPQRQQAPCAPC